MDGLSSETLELCLGLLGQVTLSAADPDIELKVTAIVRARTELTEALQQSAAPPPPG